MRNGSALLGNTAVSAAVIGAGGWMTGFEFSSDGTAFGRCDTAMPLVLAPNGTVWVKQFQPGIDVQVSDLDFTFGDPNTYACAFSWSNPAVRYVATMGWVWVKKSGATYYTKTALARRSTIDGNSNYRMSNQPLAVCPTDPSICLFIAPEGGFRLTSYGDTATAISTSSLPAPTAAGLSSVAWDRTTAGKVYAFVQGVGLYKSTDYGVTWASVAGSPTNGGCLKVSPFTGTVLIAGDSGPNDVAIKRLSGTTWTTPLDSDSAAAATHTVAFSPNTSGRVYAMAEDGGLRTSTDDGVSWTPKMSVSAGTKINDSVDVPWQTSDTGYKSVGNIEVSPLAEVLQISSGVGHWKIINPPTTGFYSTVTHWVGISLGIENMVGVGASYAPDGASAIWMQDKQSMHYGPNEVGRVVQPDYGPYRGSILRGQNSFCAPEDGTFRVTTAYTQDIAYSTNKGKTWTPCPSLRSTSGNLNGGGQVAVLSKDVWIVGQSSETPYNSTTRAKNTLYITRDRGSTWTELLIGNGNAINAMMPNFSGSARKILARDPFYTASGILGRVYFYNAGDTDNTTNADNVACKGLWRIDVPTTGTSTTTRIAGRPVSGNQDIIHNKLVVIGPGGKLAFVGGDGMPFAFRGTDNAGTLTWTEFGGTDDQSAGTKFAEVYGIGFGRARFDSSFPTIYAVGFRDTGNNHATGTTAELLRYGLWASYDDGSTWKRVATFPGGAPIRAQDLAASPVKFGEVIVTLGGMGAAVLTYDYRLRAA